MLPRLCPLFTSSALEEPASLLILVRAIRHHCKEVDDHVLYARPMLEYVPGPKPTKHCKAGSTDAPWSPIKKPKKLHERNIMKLQGP